MVTAKKAEEQPKPKPRKLAATVHVDGVAYGPNDDVPADVAAKITNEKAWATES